MYMKFIDLLVAFLTLQWGRSCPSDMVEVGKFCIDKYEAPNIRGVEPFVMFTAFEAESWCDGQGRRLCSKKEWVQACDGTYKEDPDINKSGIVNAPGVCNNDKTWIFVDGTLLVHGNLNTRTREARKLYQGEPSGFRPSCMSKFGVVDTIGNVEEWVNSPGTKHGYSLMGHYWSRASRKCSDSVAVHAPQFFYYTTGFRCCRSVYRH